MGRLKSHPKYRQFRLDAGSVSLNFVATLRHRGSQPRDLLGTPEALGAWLKIIGLSPSPAHISSIDLDDALQLREAIFRMVRDLILSSPPNSADVNLINESARFSVAIPQLLIDSNLVKWETSHPVKACLATIARDAIIISSHMERQRLKMCNDSSCLMLFRDMSPNNRRRWCSMSICGNRKKVSLHREQKKSLTAQGESS